MSTRGFATATAVVFLFCVLEPLETAAEQVERLKKCGNEFCTEVLFEAKAKKDAPASHPAFLTFHPGQDIKVYAVEMSDRKDLWEGEVNGVRGFFYLNHVSHEGFNSFVQKWVREKKLMFVLGEGNRIAQVEEAITTFAKFNYLWSSSTNDTPSTTESVLPVTSLPPPPPPLQQQQLPEVKQKENSAIPTVSSLPGEQSVPSNAPQQAIPNSQIPPVVEVADGASQRQEVKSAATDDVNPVVSDLKTVLATDSVDDLLQSVKIPPPDPVKLENIVPNPAVLENSSDETLGPAQNESIKVIAQESLKQSSQDKTVPILELKPVNAEQTGAAVEQLQNHQELKLGEPTTIQQTTPPTVKIDPPTMATENQLENISDSLNNGGAGSEPSNLQVIGEILSSTLPPQIVATDKGAIDQLPSQTTPSPPPKESEPVQIVGTTLPPATIEMPLVTPLPNVVTTPTSVPPAVPIQTTPPPVVATQSTTNQPPPVPNLQTIPLTTPPPIEPNFHLPTPIPQPDVKIDSPIETPPNLPPLPSPDLHHGHSHEAHAGHSHEAHAGHSHDSGHGHSHGSHEEGHGHSHTHMGFGRHQFKREGGKIVPNSLEVNANNIPSTADPALVQPKVVEIVDQFGQSYCEKGQPCDAGAKTGGKSNEEKFASVGQATLTELNPMKELTPEETVAQVPHYEPINFETSPPPTVSVGFGQKLLTFLGYFGKAAGWIFGFFKTLAQEIHSHSPQHYKDLCDERDTFCFCMTTALMVIYVIIRIMDSSSQARESKKAFNISRLAEKLQIAETENEKLRNICLSNSQSSTDSVKHLQSAQKERESLEAHVKNIELENQAFKESFDTLTQTNENLMKKVNNYEQLIASSKQKVLDMDTSHKAFSNENEELKRQRDSLTAQKKLIETELRETRDLIGDRDEEIRTLKDIIQETEGKLKELYRRFDEIKDLQKTTATELASKTALLETREKEIVGLQATIASLHEAIEISSSGVGETEVTDGTDSDPTSGWEIEEMASSDAIPHQKRNVQDRIDKVMDVAKLHAEIKDLENEKLKIEGMLRSEVKSKVELEAKLLAVNQEMQKVTAESGNFERKISEAETKFQIMNDYFKNQEAELKKQLTSQDIQLSQNRDKIAADEQELKLMKDEIESLKDSLDQQRKLMEDNDRKTREFQTNLQKQNTEFYTEMKQSKKERDEAIKERDKWRQNYAAEVRRNAGGVGAVNEVFGELNGHNSENELGGLQRSATSPPGGYSSGSGGLRSPDLPLMGVPLHPDLLFGPAVPPIRSRPNSFYGDPLYYSDYSGDSYSRRSFRRDKSRGRGDSPPRISPGHQQPTRPRSSYAENDPHESDRGKDEFHGGEELERGRYVRGAGYYPPPQPHRQRSRSHGRSLYSREYSDGPVGHHNYGSSSNDENISSPPPPRFAAPAVPPPGAIDPIRQRPSDRRMADSGQQRPSDSDARTTGTGNRGNGNRSNRDRH